jgi:hypothetical protein
MFEWRFGTYLTRIFRLVINSMQVVTGLTLETVACNHASTRRVVETYLQGGPAKGKVVPL